MATIFPVLNEREMAEDEYTQEPARRQILDQLSRIVTGAHFRNSKRYPALLTYIVEEAVAGRADLLKERTLGVCVFDRTPDYDTNADPVVRVTAGEVRKRIAQYYQSAGHEQELRIDVPLGSYCPRFHWPEESLALLRPVESFPLASFEEAANPNSLQAAEPLSLLSQETIELAPRPALPTRSGHKILNVLAYSGWLVALLMTALLGSLLWKALRKPPLSPGLALFWEPTLHAPIPTLIVLGVHSFDKNGLDISPSSHITQPEPNESLLQAMTQTDMVHLSDVNSYGALVQVLGNHAHGFHTQGAADTTLEQLRGGPFILIGGFNNVWTKRLSQQLRFRFVTFNGRTNVIQDSQHPETFWTIDTQASAIGNAQDYGVVSRFLDPETDQNVIMAAGIGRSGTEAASDFLSSDKGISAWLKSLPAHSGNNVQAVVATDVIEGKHGPPHVIAYTFW